MSPPEGPAGSAHKAGFPDRSSALRLGRTQPGSTDGAPSCSQGLQCRLARLASCAPLDVAHLGGLGMPALEAVEEGEKQGDQPCRRQDGSRGDDPGALAVLAGC